MAHREDAEGTMPSRSKDQAQHSFTIDNDGIEPGSKRPASSAIPERNNASLAQSNQQTSSVIPTHAPSFTYGQAITPSMNFTGTRKGPLSLAGSQQVQKGDMDRKGASDSMKSPPNVAGRDEDLLSRPLDDEESRILQRKASPEAIGSSNHNQDGSSDLYIPQQGDISCEPSPHEGPEASQTPLSDVGGSESTAHSQVQFTASGTDLEAVNMNRQPNGQAVGCSLTAFHTKHQSRVNGRSILQPPGSKPAPHEHSPGRSIGEDGRPSHQISAMRKSDEIKPFSDNSLQSASTLDDLLQSIAIVWRGQEHALTAEYSEEREVWKAELLHTLSKNDDLQNQITSLVQNNQNLTKTIAGQTTKLKTYEAKLQKCRKFIDGLGNDLDVLKRDSNAQRQQSDELAEEILDQRATQHTLRQHLVACGTDFSKLNDRVMNNYREISKEFEVSQERIKYLERQLHEKAGLLAEERDLRARLSTEHASAEASSQAILDLVHFNHENVLQILEKIQATVESDNRNSDIHNSLKDLSAALQMTHDQGIHTDGTIIALKGILEDRITTIVNQIEALITRHNQEAPNKDWLISHMNDILFTLKSSLLEGINDLQAERVEREAIVELRSQLQTSSLHLASTTSQLSTSVASESELKKQISSLQENIDALQNQAMSHGVEPVELSQLKVDLQLKESIIESLRSELAEKVEHLCQLTSTNAKLQDQVDDLQARLETVSTTLAVQQSEHQQLAQTHREETANIRSQLSKQAKQFHTEQKCRMNNEVKQVSHERDVAVMQLQESKTLLAEVNAEIQRLQVELKAQSGIPQQDIETILQQTKSHKEELERSEGLIFDLQRQVIGYESLKDENVKLTAQCAEQNVKLEKFEVHKDALLRQLQDLQASTTDAQSQKDLVIANLEQSCREKDDKLVDLRARLEQAEEAAKKIKESISQANKDYATAVVEERQKASRQTGALQKRLAEAEAELYQKKKEDRTFRSEVEQSWRVEQDGHKRLTADLQDRLVKVQAALDKLNAENEQLRREPGIHSQEDRVKLHDSAQPFNPATASTVQVNINAAPLLNSVNTEDTQVSGITTDSNQPKTSEVLHTRSSTSDAEPTLVEDHQRTIEPSQLGIPSTTEADQNDIATMASLIDGVVDFAGGLTKEVAGDVSEGPNTSGQMVVTHLKPIAERALKRLYTSSPPSFAAIERDSHARETLGDHTESGRYIPMYNPRPNSGSKRTPVDVQVAKTPSLRSESQEYGTISASALKETEPINQNHQSSKGRKGQHSSPADSSTPGFISEAVEDRSLKTYHGSRGSRQRTTDSTSDPRFRNIGSARTPKRQPDTEALQSFEPERKRRTNANIGLVARSGTDMSQISARDKPHMAAPFVGHGRQWNSALQSRMQTFDGRSVRRTRGSRRSSKNAEMSARFSDELANL